MSIHQISVFLENRAGQLSQITGTLAENGIDLRAINIAETEDYGMLRMIASDSRRAAAVLSERGYIASVTPVVAVGVPDEPGGLHRLLECMAEEDIDVEYMYSVFGHRDGMAYMIFRVNEPDRLSAVLDAHGFHPLSSEELGMKT